MLTFKRFLEAEEKAMEAPKELDRDALVVALKKHCSAALAAAKREDSALWRGWKRNRPTGIYNPASGKRVSENTTNYYTVLLDTNPANSAWPKRSHSFICSTSRNTAMGYSPDSNYITRVFPFDGAKLGVIERGDIWRTRITFKKLGAVDSINALNKFWKFVTDNRNPETMQGIIQDLRNKDPEKVVEVFEDLAAWNRPAGMPPEEVVKRLIDDLPDAYAYSTIDGIKLQTVNDLNEPRAEVWFSSRCILVNRKDEIIMEKLGL